MHCDNSRISEIKIGRADEAEASVGGFINREFSGYGERNGLTLNYDEFCFVAEDGEGIIVGAITGRAYYNEVHIGDLIVAEGVRRSGLGSLLVRAVEENYRGRGYGAITLSTFGFQAPEFYKKLGYTLEFVRVNEDERLSKYFFKKPL